LTTLSDEAAKGLAKFKGHLVLSGLKAISDKAAQALAEFKGDLLNLEGLKTLSDKAAEALAKFEGDHGGELILKGSIKKKATTLTAEEAA
jgi:hypothetical protein